MSTIRQLLKEKGSHVWSVTPQISAFDALKVMAEKNIGALLVLDNGKLSGIFSERDYARKVVLKGKTSQQTPVKDLMTSEVFCIAPDRSIEESMALMTEKHVRHLPVVENDQLLGIVTIGDLVKKIIEDKNFTIQELEKFISGSGYGA